MIGGLILGSGDGVYSEVIVRGIGPSLAGQVSSPLSNPSLELHNSSGDTVASNDDWMTDPNMAAVVAQNLAPHDPKESAIDMVLQLGAYTAVLRGVGGSGVGLVECYDVSSGTPSPGH